MASQERLKILATIGLDGSVRFTTNRGVVNVTQAEAGSYSVTYEPLQDWFAWLLVHESWFPRIVRVLARMYSGFSKATVLILGLLWVYLSIQLDWYIAFLTSPPTTGAGTGAHFLAIAAAVTVGIFTIQYTRQKVSPWARVAELVREAYDTTGTFEVDPARYGVQSGRYNAWRFLLPVLALDQLTERLARRLGIPSLFMLVLACELVLWIDVWVGWYRVPVVKQFMRLTQGLLYPTPPTEEQVQAAQLALTELVKRDRMGKLSS